MKGLVTGVAGFIGFHLAERLIADGGTGVPTVSLRYFTVFGPRQRPDMAFHRFIGAWNGRGGSRMRSEGAR